MDGVGESKPKKPKGWYSAAAKAARSAVWRDRRERAALERQLKEIRGRKMLQIRAGAEARLAEAVVERKIHAALRKDRDELELRLAADRLIAADAFDHKNEGTFQTHAHAANAGRSRPGSLSKLFTDGEISRDEWAWAGEIAMVAEAIERDVAVRVVSYEMRIDCSASGRNEVIEGPLAIRMQVAYSHWRRWLPDPKRMILDMIVGDAKPFTTVAREYGVHKRRTRALLIGSIQMWPDALEAAEVEIEAAKAGLF